MKDESRTSKQTAGKRPDDRAPYREIAKNIPGMVYRVYLREKNHMEFFNDMVRDMTGYDPSELASGDVCSIDPLIFPGDRERVISEVRKAVADRCPFEVEYRLNHKSGAIRHFIERGQPISGPDERPLFIDGVIFDNTDRRHAEEKLRKSEEYFRAITENATDIILIVNKKGTITYASPSVEHILGFRQEELIGKGSLDLIVPDDLPRAIHDFGRAILTKGVLVPNAFRVRHKDGSERILEGVGRNLFDNPTVSGFVMNVRDVSDRRKAEEALRESEEKFRTLIELTQDLVYRVDRRGCFIYVNPMLEKVTGYTASELRGQPFTTIITPEFRAATIDYFRKGIKDEKVPPYECEITAKDGTRTNVEFIAGTLHDKDGKPMGRFGIGRDVTERKQAEDALQAAEELYRTLAESSQIAIYIVQDKKIVFSNFHLSQYSGFVQEELIGKDISAFVYPDDRDMVRKKASQMLKGETSMPYEYRIIDKNGRIRWLVETVSSINYHGKRATLGNTLDITEQKRIKKQLEETKDMLVQSEKLTAMGRLSSGAAHEIRNPLNILSLNLQMLDIKGKLDDETKKAVDVCHTQIDRIVKIIEGLQKFSRKSEKKISPENIREVIDHVLSLSAPRLKTEDITFSVKHDQDIPVIFMDRAAMEQVFFNLVSNALDAMKDRGKRVLTISAERKDDTLLVTVSDTGHGIPEENLEILFDPFFTTKDPDKGSGLGLSISYGIILDHQGNIRAQNNEAGGASFFIELPIKLSEQ